MLSNLGRSWEYFIATSYRQAHGFSPRCSDFLLSKPSLHLLPYTLGEHPCLGCHELGSPTSGVEGRFGCKWFTWRVLPRGRGWGVEETGREGSQHEEC